LAAVHAVGTADDEDDPDLVLRVPVDRHEDG
jgi:hypothetical protein